MRYGVLGTLTVVDDDGANRSLGGPARRRLLGALLARHGHTVSIDRLLTDLWGDAPPATAEKTLQGHIVRLRDALGRDQDGSPIRTDPTGYRLEVAPSAIDAWCFERDLTAGRQVLAADDAESAVALLDQALSWWRDEAYVEFPEAPFAVSERLRLHELRGLAAEARTDAVLALGAGVELIGELEQRVREDPYRERSWQQLVIALYRSGRQADALTAYRRARDRLVDDLGVEPSAALRSLEARVLTQDPELDGPARAEAVITMLAGASANSPFPIGAVVPALSAPDHAAAPSVALAAPVIPQCPYRGLSSYTEDDASIFVGRERLTAQLSGRLVDNDLLVVVGPSGAGKSSLLRAGLAPALRRGAIPGSSSWRIRIVTPGTDPLDALDAERCDLLIVDQAEGLFILAGDADLHLVGARLAAALAAGTRVVLAVRGDFYGRLADLDVLTGRIGGATVLVGPMSEEETRRVVVEPAASHGVDVAPALVDEIVADVAGRSGSLPLLSAALEQAWQYRTGDRLTLEDYRRGGGVSGALETMAENTFGCLDPSAQSAARRILLRLTTLSGPTWVRRPLPVDDLVPDNDDAGQRALEVLAARRLVLVDAGGVELTHEALLTGWPRLRRWLDERGVMTRQLEHLATSATVWDRTGRPLAELLRGPRLQGALEWCAQHPDDLSPVEHDYLAASRDAIDSALATERRRRRRLTAAVAAVAVFALVASLIGVIAVREKQTADTATLSADAGRLAALSYTATDIPTALLLAAAGYRLTDSPDTRGALLNADERSSGQLFRQSFDNGLLWVEPIGDGSRLLVMDNNQMLLTVDPATRKVVSRFHAPGNVPSGLSPDGSTLVMCGAGGAGNATLIDPSTGTVGRTLSSTTTSTGVGRCGAFTGDGRFYVALQDLPVPGTPFVPGHDPPNAVAVFTTADWSAPPRLLHLDSPVTAFDVATNEFALQHQDGTLEVLAASTLAVREHAVRPELANDCVQVACHIALSPDGTLLAFVDPTAAQAPRLVLTADLGGHTSTGQGITSTISAMVYSGDDAQLAIASNDGSLVVVNSATGATNTAQPGNGGSIVGMAWAGKPSSQHLYTVGLDNALTSWELNPTPRDLTLGPTVPSDDGDDGHVGNLVIGTRTGSTQIYALDLRTGTSTWWPVALADDERGAWIGATNDGSRAVISTFMADGSARFRVWDLATGQVKLDHRLAGKRDTTDPLAAAFNADGTQLFTTSGRNSVDVVDIATDRILRSFSINLPGTDSAHLWVEPFAIDPHGSLLVAAEDHQTPTAPATGSTPATPAPSSADELALVDPSTGAVTARRRTGSPLPFATTEWSADGTRIVVGTASGTIQVFDSWTLTPLSARVLAHSGSTLAASFSPDGSTIVTSGSDGNVQFWDAGTLRRLGSVVRLGPDSWVWAWYLPDGRVAGTMPATRDGHAPNQSFTMPGTPSAWLSDACAFAGRDLTPQEWATIVTDQPYRPTCPHTTTGNG